MKNRKSNHSIFRQNLNEINSLIIYKILKNYQTKKKKIITSINKKYLNYKFNKNIIFIPILKTKLKIINNLLKLIPKTKIKHIKINKNKTTFKPTKYFYKIPEIPKNNYIFIINPILTTKNNTINTITKLRKNNFNNINLIYLIKIKKNVNNIKKHFNHDINIYLTTLNKYLNKNKYIKPKLNNTKNKIFNTK